MKIRKLAVGYIGSMGLTLGKRESFSTLQEEFIFTKEELREFVDYVVKNFCKYKDADDFINHLMEADKHEA